MTTLNRQRIREEKNELIIKISKAQKFLNGYDSNSLSKKALDLLHKQITVMEFYVMILEERLLEDSNAFLVKEQEFQDIFKKYKITPTEMIINLPRASSKDSSAMTSILNELDEILAEPKPLTSKLEPVMVNDDGCQCYKCIKKRILG